MFSLFGRSALNRNEKNPVASAVRQASAGPSSPRGRGRRLVTSFFIQFGLGLLHQGHVLDAATVLRLRLDKDAGDPGLAAAAEVVEGERAVLSGSWRAPVASAAAPRVPHKVLHIVGKSMPYVVAGYTVRTQSAVEALRDAGFAPEVVTRLGFPWDAGVAPQRPEERVNGIVHHHIGGAAVPARWDDRLTANVEALGPVVEAVRPGLLHAHSDFENALLALALRDRYGLPVVYELRGFWEETWLAETPAHTPAADRYRWRHEREIAAVGAADHAVTLAETMRVQLVEAGVAAEHVSIVPNAVDPDRFPRVERDPVLAASLGIGPDEVTVGYVSSLSGYEGVGTLLRAVRRVAASGRNVRGIVVGDGDERESLERLARRLGLADRVVFTGRVAHDLVLAYYSVIDVFVVPRTNDRVCHLVTPLKPFEAMSTGRALVMSSVAALREIAEASGAAATFPPEDDAALAEVLEGLLDDPGRRGALADAGASWVREHRTWAANAQRYRRVYAGLGVE
jgi:glycosyltransferase involved in cell wall biosynthesis